VLVGAALAPTVVAGNAVKPDLLVRGVVASQSAVEVGAGFQASVTVANVGGGKASSSATAFFLSVDARKSVTDIRVAGVAGIGGLGARRAAPGSTTVTVKRTIPLGSYFVLACADAGSRVGELSEKNNCRASEKRVRVVAPAPRPPRV